MGFKDNTVFLRFLSMGVYAADAISRDLEFNHEHRTIELERYAKANKVWQTKVKRMRLPDLMCIRCGCRFECKGKDKNKKFEVKLSDSTLPGREWRDGGMRLEDVFAFALVDMDATPVRVSNPVYVTRQALEDALPSSREGNRKASSDGSELDRTWPMWAPPYSGTVIEVVNTKDARKVKVTKDPIGKYTYNATKWKNFHSLAVGERFEAGQPVAHSFQIPSSVTCKGDHWDWRADLISTNDNIRYPAVKAARFLGAQQVEATLLDIANNKTNDWRVRLEVHASLAMHRPASIEELSNRAVGPEATDEERMESVFSLSEIDTAASTEALFSIASSTDPAIPEEVRAAAAWGLGTGVRKAPDKLMPLLDEPNTLVATHAAAVLPEELPQRCLNELEAWLVQDDPRRAATASHLLAERGRVKELAKALEAAPERTRRLIVLALADSPRDAVQDLLSDLDDRSRIGVITLWAKDDDWLRQPETDGILDALKQQQLRR